MYPTGNLPKKQLSKMEKRIFDLVVRRFMAVFGEPAIKQSIKVSTELNGHIFYLRGTHSLVKGWMNFYMPYIKAEEVQLPPIEVGSKVRLIKVEREDKFTNPPSRYNPSSILQKMEKVGLGTKATRADIIEALYSRDYIKERRIIVTDLGFDVAGVLEGYCPTVVSVKLTRHLEEKMVQIQNNMETSERVLIDAVDQLRSMLEKLKENEKEVGEVLSNAIKKARMQERIVGKCNDCGSGNLMILYSRKTRKRFIGCTNYFEGLCKTSFSLPQKGTVKPVRKNCTVCGWPIVQIRMKGRRPWMLCFNSCCPLKEEKS